MPAVPPTSHSAARPIADDRRLLDFVRAAGDWLWECDAQLDASWLSDEFEAVTGLPAQAVLGRPMGDPPLLDDIGLGARRRGSLGLLLQRRRPFSRAVTELATPRGTMYVSRSAVPVFDDAGRFAGFRGTARDVTPQVEAVRRSRSHDVLLRKLASQVPGVIFQFKREAEGRFSYPYASEGLRAVFGVGAVFDAPDDASVPLRMLHADDRADFVAAIEQSAQAMQPLQREYRIVRDDGSVRWLETRATPERLPDGATLWHGFTADITERKQTELALRRSEERWELAADAAGIGLAELDLASGHITLDRRACVNHGLTYPASAYRVDRWVDAIDAADREAVARAVERAVAQRGTLHLRYRLWRPDGSRVTLEATARCRCDAHGTPTALVGTCRDVTAQLAVEELQRDKEAAERANRAKSEFLSRVSHELRTPLNGILGFAQLMALDRVDTLAPAQQRRLESVLRAGSHLLELINDVLDLTRIESDDFVLRAASVDAVAALDECLALIQPLADAAGVRLPAAPLAVAPLWVSADPRAFEQVLMNLLSNAIKFNRPAGAVEIEIGAAADPARVRIAIRDQGRGMTAEQQAGLFLFQPFNRLGAEHRRIEGSGLGLVICRRLLDAMDGSVHVASTPGVGSTFSVELPAAAPQRMPAAAPARVQPAAAPADTGPRQVLYIEDEPLNVVVMQEVFRRQPQWTLSVADDGATGWDMALATQPDLLLVDINLPDTNGLALVQRLRDDARTRTLRCIALSADAMREQIDAALAAGFDDYWTKPIDVRKVLDELGRLLARAPRPREGGVARPAART